MINPIIELAGQEDNLHSAETFRPDSSQDEPPTGSPAPLIDDIGLSANAFYLLRQRFLRQNEQGETIETPAGMFRRVARALAAVEATPADVSRIYQMAWRLGGKGITVYRDQSRQGQTIEFAASPEIVSGTFPTCINCN